MHSTHNNLAKGGIRYWPNADQDEVELFADLDPNTHLPDLGPATRKEVAAATFGAFYTLVTRNTVPVSITEVGAASDND
ncbi:glutamate dehydrogenase (plasmid) [Pseudosulfitobacter pseudonitzschiae]|uniref:Glutamate dehydrogenase n=1 Tax=Pseudosulfitobacter pseudonitzschiae TaxID=1402135 RepID=A0A221K9F7_9RHOB|nr:glutamate dehydrogenase [Pseudosulfitobacter pseudonitzschiae]